MTDIVILIASRERRKSLLRLLHGLQLYFEPIVRHRELTLSVCVYEQSIIDPSFGIMQNMLHWQALEVVHAPQQRTMGAVVVAMVQQFADKISASAITIMMDDDCVMYPSMRTAQNINNAMIVFESRKSLLFNIRYGSNSELDLMPLLHAACPFMPSKEKMFWVNPAFLLEATQTDVFATIEVGEDIVLAALAWLRDPNATHSVYGIRDFFSLSGERAPYSNIVEDDYDELLLSGFAALLVGKENPIGPVDVMPDVFVPEEHPLYVVSGVRLDTIARIIDGGVGPAFELE